MQKNRICIITVFLISFLSIGSVYAQWTPLGPSGGDVPWIDTAGSDLFAESSYDFYGAKYNLFRSGDNGGTWEPVDKDLSGAGPFSGIVAGADSAGAFLVLGTNKGIYISRNKGSNWDLLTTLVASPIGVCSGSVIAWGNDTIYRWSGGSKWLHLTNGLPQSFSLRGLIIRGSDLVIALDTDYYGTDYRVFRSSDCGTTWVNTFSYQLQPYGTGGLVLIGPDIYQFFDNSVFRSTDDGLTWKYAVGISLFFSRSYVSVGNTFVVSDGNSRISKSNDSGAHWIDISKGLEKTGQFRRLFSLGTKLFLTTAYQGIMASTDTGSTWKESNAGMNNASINNGLYTESSDVFIAIDDEEELFHSGDDGNNWEPVNNALPSWTSLYIPYFSNIVHQGADLYVTDGVGVYHSTDKGKSWMLVGLDTIRTQWLAADSVRILANNSTDIYSSTDNGAHWKTLKSPAPYDPSSNDQNYIQTVTLNGNSILAATTWGVYRSTNLGSSWRRVSDSAAVYLIVGSGALLFCGTDQGIWRSLDGGATWHKANNGIPNAASSDFYDFVFSRKTVFASTTNGIFRSGDNGTNWGRIDDNIPGLSYAWMLAASDRYLFAGTDGHGVWRRPLSDLEFAPAPSSLQGKYSLANHPDPFTHFTTITLSVPITGDAEITIINLLGAEVARLFSGELEAGEHNFTWDARGIPSGIYICEVLMNGQILRSPMILMR